MGLKVIGAGFGRTGTNSFQVAMEMLGFGPCHHMNVLMSEPGPVDAWRRAADGTLTDWDEIYGAFSATCDFPHCVFYEELAAFYPDAKVVLTVRDPDEWYTSAMSTIFSPENQARNRGADSPLDPAMMGYVFKCVSRVVDISNVDDKDSDDRRVRSAQPASEGDGSRGPSSRVRSQRRLGSALRVSRCARARRGLSLHQHRRKSFRAGRPRPGHLRIRCARRVARDPGSPIPPTEGC